MAMLDERRDSAGPAGRKRELLLRLLREQNAGRPRSPGAAALPVIEPDPVKRGDPFPLTEIQQAYWIGRSAAHEIGDVSIHAYVEVEGDGVD
nr:hypothetical protein [Actinomycetota bacterium]